MAYQLKSNPLENNPLFSAQPDPQPDPLPNPQPESQPEPQPGQPAPQQSAPQKSPKNPAKKSARKPSGRGVKKNASAPASVPNDAESVPAAQQNLRKADNDAYTRATFIVRRDLLELLKDYAYTERREIKDVINEILSDALAKIESDYAADGRKLIGRK